MMRLTIFFLEDECHQNKKYAVMSSHFHNDRKLSSNTTNSSLPNQTICFQLPGSCLSFKLWKNATTVTSPHFPFHNDRRLSYKLLKVWEGVATFVWPEQEDRSDFWGASDTFEERQRFHQSVRDQKQVSVISSWASEIFEERQRYV